MSKVSINKFASTIIERKRHEWKFERYTHPMFEKYTGFTVFNKTGIIGSAWDSNWNLGITRAVGEAVERTALKSQPVNTTTAQPKKFTSLLTGKKIYLPYNQVYLLKEENPLKEEPRNSTGTACGRTQLKATNLAFRELCERAAQKDIRDRTHVFIQNISRIQVDDIVVSNDINYPNGWDLICFQVTIQPGVQVIIVNLKSNANPTRSVWASSCKETQAASILSALNESIQILALMQQVAGRFESFPDSKEPDQVRAWYWWHFAEKFGNRFYERCIESHPKFENNINCETIGNSQELLNETRHQIEEKFNGVDYIDITPSWAIDLCAVVRAVPKKPFQLPFVCDSPDVEINAHKVFHPFV